MQDILVIELTVFVENWILCSILFSFWLNANTRPLVILIFRKSSPLCYVFMWWGRLCVDLACILFSITQFYLIIFCLILLLFEKDYFSK